MKRRHFLAIPLVLSPFVVNAVWAEERATRPAFKGMELYSWKTSQGWAFALLDGTNRNKAWPEILAAEMSENQLKARLRLLAVDEQIFWLQQCEGVPLAVLCYPPPATLAELEGLCAELRLGLVMVKAD